jgi:hypothetical protein
VLKKKVLVAMLMVFSMLMLEAQAQQEVGQTWVSKNEHFKVMVESELDPIVINQMHSWTLQLQNAQGQAVTDADLSLVGGMPAHNHGLATAPVIEPAGVGSYLLQGLRFHMMGYWELELTIDHAGISDIVLITLEL